MSHKQANRWGDKWIHKPTHTKTDMHTYKEITILWGYYNGVLLFFLLLGYVN